MNLPPISISFMRKSKNEYMFTVKLWTEILKSDEHMEFMENINIRSANHYAAFHHDHCMKGAKNPDTLDKVFGEGNRFKTPSPGMRL